MTKMNFFLVILSLYLGGCANFGMKLKSFLRGEEVRSGEVENSQKFEKRFSQDPNYAAGPKRQYKRTTRSSLENEALLAENSGSLWVMEGQGAYLFSQNIMRMIGDPLGVRIEGESKEQLESKVKIITDLLNLLANKRKMEARKLAEAQGAGKSNQEKSKEKPEEKAGENDPKGKDEMAASFPVKTVPTRIIERLVDGNYRVKGAQPFMIGKREYSVIVTGIVRAEDFAEDGVSSTQLLDPKFDIVSKKRRETSL